MGLILGLFAKFILLRPRSRPVSGLHCMFGAAQDIAHNGSVIDQLQAMVGGAGCISAGGC